MRSSHFDQSARSALVVACCVLLGGGVSFQIALKALSVYLQKKPVEMRGSFSTISRTLGPWKAVGDDRTLDDAMVEELGTNKYLDRVFVRESDLKSSVLNVHISYYTGMIDAVPHVPDRCMVAGGGFNAKTLPRNMLLPIDRSTWQPDPEYTNVATGKPYETVSYQNDFIRTPIHIRMPVGDLEIRVTEFEHADQPNLRTFGGYFFIANGRLTPAPEGVRAMAFNLSEQYAYYCKVQFVYEATDATPEKFVALAADLLQYLLPELMQRLPDWAEVERSGKQTLKRPSAQTSMRVHSIVQRNWGQSVTPRWQFAKAPPFIDFNDPPTTNNPQTLIIRSA